MTDENVVTPKGARFLRRDGEPFPPQASVTLRDLAEARLEVFSTSPRLTLDGTLSAEDVGLDGSLSFFIELPQPHEGRVAFELREAVAQAEDLFAQSEHPQAFVTLRVDGGGPNTLLVRRYDYSLKREAGGLRLVGLTGEAIADTGSWTLEAVRLWQPGAARETGIFTPRDGVWSVATESLAPGPWLVLARRGGVVAARPFLLQVRQDTGSRGPLARAISGRTRKEIRTLCRGALEEMLERPLDEEWTTATDLLKLAGELQNAALIPVGVVAETPRAAVMALVHSGVDRQLVWDVLSRHGLEWALVPLADWVAVLTSYRQALEESGEGEKAARELDSLFTFLGEPGERELLGPAVEWVQRSLGSKGGGGAETSVEEPFSRLVQLRNELLERHRTSARWPRGRALKGEGDPALAGLLERLGGAAAAEVIVAPLWAAYASVAGAPGDRTRAFDIRAARRFDPTWFSKAYRIALEMRLKGTG